MRDEDMSVDQLLTELYSLLGDETSAEEASSEPAAEAAEQTELVEQYDPIEPFEQEEPAPTEEDWAYLALKPNLHTQDPPTSGDAPEPEEMPGPEDTEVGLPQSPSRGRRVLRILARCGIILVETALLGALGLYCLLYVVAKGPSTTASELFVLSVRETNAVRFLADVFFTEEEIAAIQSKAAVPDYVAETDTSLIQIPTDPDDGSDSDDGTQTPVADAWGLIDEDGDGIILETVNGEGYTGYMMVVLDPSRVIMGSVPYSYGGRGYTVEQMCGVFDAVAGINAGGFYDPNGLGDGSTPDAMVVFEGEIYYADSGTRKGFVGLDSNSILHVFSSVTVSQIRANDIQYGVSFGPVLVANGEACDVGSSGLNPRTAIGQRSDGAILLLVIDGRQVLSIGATWQDLVDIMLDYGAVNACNLDGGSSSLMWYNGEYVNNCASVVGIRPVPTTFVVLKEN